MGFLGVKWLLEAAYLLPETVLKSPGVRELPGPRRVFAALIEPSSRNVTGFLKVVVDNLQGEYDFRGLCKFDGCSYSRSLIHNPGK
jgi:hypothetical protein